jgi:uncharacterized protein (TIGR02996 family)
MVTDAQFLAAVAVAPDDRTPRLAYADWLDEQDDPRGELIRLEEESRGRVAWDATLWRLKPRRNELRRQIDPAWLAAMRYGTDCEPLFRGQPFPYHWADAWRLIREAHERRTGKQTPDTGGHAAEVEEVERRLGRALPPSVREHIAFACDCEDREYPQHLIDLALYTLAQVPGHPALSLQSAEDCRWAVRYEDLHLDDPPVYMYHWGDSEEVFVQAQQAPSPSVSRFVFDGAHGYSSGNHGTLDVGVKDVEETRTRLRKAFPFCTSLDGVEMYEMTNISARLETPDRYHLGRVRVSISRPVAREQIPDFLWDYCRGGGGFGGIFADECERVRPSHSGLPPEPAGGDDPIPF